MADTTTCVESKFFDLSVELMCIATLDGKILKINPAWTKTLGVTSKQIQGHYLCELAHPYDKQAIRSTVGGLNCDNSSAEVTGRYRLTNGDYIWLRWNFNHDCDNQQIYAIARDITEQERMRASLAILEEVTGVGVWEINQDTEALYWSDKIHDIHETDAQHYHPKLEEGINFYADEAIPPLKAALEHLAATGEPYSLDLPFITAKKNRIWVNARGFTKLQDGKVIRQYGTFENITEKRAEALEKQKLQARIELSLRTSNIGIWEFELADNCLHWDDQMYRLYGIQSQDFHHKIEDWEVRLHPEDKAAAQTLFNQAISSGSEFNMQFRIITPGGELRHIAAIASFTKDEQGIPVRATGVNWDVTEQALARIALEEEKHRAEQNAELAKKADQAKSVFLANMSHEIRTPMNGLLGALQLLEHENTDDPQTAQLLDQAIISTKGLIKIVNDILDFSKITAHEIQFEQTSVDLKSLLGTVCTELNWAAKEQSLSLQLSYPDKVPNQWIGDPVRIKQIVTNIASNAIKFTDEGQVSISVDDKATYQNQDCLSITVEDTGIGIEPQFLPKLFDAFSQADDSTTRKFGGTGLGLSISLQLARLMSGDIEVQSTPGQGTCFTIYLPLEADTSEQQNPGQMLSNEPKIADLSGLRVLLAEDNLINREVLKAMLLPTNAEIESVNDGAELLEAYNENKPDLVLTDIQMPVLDGVEACIEIRREDSQTPIIAVTANVMSQDCDKYLQCGFNDYIAKPIVVAELYEVLNRHKP